MSQAGSVGEGGSGPGGQDLHVAQFIVNSSGTTGTGANYTTIGAAIAAAPSGASIFIMPGTYTENLTITKSLAFFASQDAQEGLTNLVGSMSFSGNIACSVNGFRITDNGSSIIVNSGSSETSVIFTSMVFVMNNAVTAISYTNSSSSAFMRFINCYSAFSGAGGQLFNSTSPSSLQFFYCMQSEGVLTQSTISAGLLNISYSQMSMGITSSGTSSVTLFLCEMGIIQGGALSSITIGGSGTNSILNCVINSGANTAIVVNSPTTISNTVVTCTNATAAISGTSTLTMNSIEFASTGNLITTSVVIPDQTQMGALKLLGGFSENYTPTAVNYQVLITDDIIGVNSTIIPRTITMPLSSAGMFVGQTWTIKDESGGANTHNITVLGNGSNIDGSSSYVMNTNFASLTLYWNGSNFFVK